MRYNSAQKAQQALEQLTKEGDLEDRLRRAFGYLAQAGGKDYAQDSNEITDAYKKASDALDGGNYHAFATGIRELIEAIFIEEGANATRQKFEK